jgi:hypothetical protein
VAAATERLTQLPRRVLISPNDANTRLTQIPLRVLRLSAVIPDPPSSGKTTGSRSDGKSF